MLSKSHGFTNVALVSIVIILVHKYTGFGSALDYENLMSDRGPVATEAAPEPVAPAVVVAPVVTESAPVAVEVPEPVAEPVAQVEPEPEPVVEETIVETMAPEPVAPPSEPAVTAPEPVVEAPQAPEAPATPQWNVTTRQTVMPPQNHAFQGGPPAVGNHPYPPYGPRYGHPAWNNAPWGRYPAAPPRATGTGTTTRPTVHPGYGPYNNPWMYRGWGGPPPGY